MFRETYCYDASDMLSFTLPGLTAYHILKSSLPWNMADEDDTVFADLERESKEFDKVYLQHSKMTGFLLIHSILPGC